MTERDDDHRLSWPARALVDVLQILMLLAALIAFIALIGMLLDTG